MKNNSVKKNNIKKSRAKISNLKKDSTNKSNAKKNRKKFIIVTALLIALVLAVIGGLNVYKNVRRGKISVYSASDFSMDNSMDTTQCNGMVKTDKLQKILISDTQTVKEIFVEEGQEVKTGDQIMSFDTSLSDIDLLKAQVEVDRQQNEVNRSKNELNRLNNARSLEQLKSERDGLEKKLEKAKNDAGYVDDETSLTLPEGDGTEEKPVCVLWDPEKDMMSQEKLKGYLGDKTDAYVLLVTSGDIGYQAYKGFRLVLNEETGEVLTKFADDLEIPKAGKSDAISSLEDRIMELDDLISTTSSSAELAKMKKDLRCQISEGEIAVKLAQVNLKKLENEVSDGIVRAQIDGVVRSVKDPKQAYNEGAPVVEISGGGGYYINGAISELDLDNIKVGQTVDINSWMSGSFCQGEVKEISKYPTDNANAWSNGNPNVSYYPMKIFVSEDATLEEGEYVDITYSGASDEDSWYLDSMFIRDDNGRSYVYVKDEKGKLAKRYISTGKNLWGSYTQIKSGLTLDDMVAFPYGQDVQEGAATKDSTVDEFYSY